MPKMTFRGAYIRHYDGRHEEGGQFIRLHLTADFSEPVRKSMGWDLSDLEELPGLVKLAEEFPDDYRRIMMALPQNVTQGKLVGDLAATSIEMIPNGAELKTHAMTLDCTSISDFNFFRVKQDNGTSELELRFTALIRHPGSASKLEGYIEAIGSSPAQLKVGYTKQAELDLDGAEATEDDEEEELDLGCVDCNNKIPFEEGSDSVHASGQKCTRSDRGPALASVSEMKRTVEAVGTRRGRGN